MNEEVKPISLREFGRRYDVSDTAIRFYIKKGHIEASSIVINPKNNRPQIIEHLAVENLRKNYKVDWGLSVSSTDETKAITEKIKKTDFDKSNPKKGGEYTDSITAVNLQIQKVKLQKETLELKKKEGELVGYMDVQRALFDKGTDIKLLFQSLPSQIIDEVIAGSLESRHKAITVLSNAIDQCLFKLSGIENFEIKR